MTTRTNPTTAPSTASGHEALKPAASASATAYDRELQVARDAAMAAGEILQRYFRDGGYQIDSKGKKTGVVLSLRRYRKLMEDLHDLAVVAERRSEPTISLEEMKRRLKKNDRL